ncbi:MAG: UPF0182 family protein [bacterium]
MKVDKKFILRVVIIFLCVIGIGELANMYGELLWFGALEYASVFWTILLAKGGLGLLFGLFFALIMGINMYCARKIGPPKTGWEFSYRTEGLNTIKVISIAPHYVNRILVVFCIILSIIMGIWPAILKWNQFLRFLYQTPFTRTDPIFQRDIGFYVFSYPIQVFLQQWLLYTMIAVTLVVGYIYQKDKAIKLKLHDFMFTHRAKIHLSLLVGFILLLIAWNRRLKTFQLLYSTRGVAFGAGYTDMNVQLIAYWIMIVIASLCAIIFWVRASAVGWKLPLAGVIMLIVIKIVISELTPWAMQKFMVEPNELTLETPYIHNNIRYTRLGYDLDKIEEKDFQASTNLTLDALQQNSPTIKNVKLWDKTTLRQTYSELQEMRLYYNFIKVNEDRYIINGEKTQVMLSARELDQGNLPVQAQTFENKYFKYTHGYGLCMSPVNNVTEKGLPNLIIKDIPPVSETNLRVTRPEIYYGAKTNGFVIVNTKSQEFDFPKGDINMYSRYKGKGGVPIGSFFNRLIFSVKFFEPRILFTGYIMPESRIMFHRKIRERVRNVAPFLIYDRNPYLVLSDNGHLFWIQDAYTTTNKYPYSEQFTLFPDEGASGLNQRLTSSGLPNPPKEINYIRNSVKIVIDAYNGDTLFYVIDEEDPIIRTYRKIFPRLFKSFSEMPQDVRAHIRYPQDLFEIQAHMYRTYHMQDAQVFYNKEDLWDMPLQKNLTNRTRFPMKGYYIIMRLPDRESEEFMLMVPFTPNNKSNTIAWMCAQCDGPDYGKLLVYKFPKEKLIYGPRQVEARIDQQTEISSVLTLWSQQGSDVLRGDLLVIPVEQSILYIEPVYLIATDKSNLPELKRVIVAYGEKIEMAETLGDALLKIFGTREAEASSQVFTQGLDVVDTNGRSQSIEDLAKKVTQYYHAAQESIQKGRWIEYGQYQDLLHKAIQDLSGAFEHK